MSRRFDISDQFARRLLFILIVLLGCAIGVIGVIVSDRIDSSGSHALNAAVARVNHVAREETLGGCIRSNAKTVVSNRTGLAQYLFLVHQAELVASYSTDPRIRRLAILDRDLAGHAAWQPLTNCQLAVPEGPRYLAPAPILFSKRMPKRSDLTFPAMRSTA